MPTERHRANFLLTRDPRSLMEEPTSTTAIMPKMAMPASVVTNPARAGAKLDPASWPMAGGKIMFPAPKKMANRVRETERSCLRLSFFIVVSLTIELVLFEH